jgi:hypothetical protein
MEFFAREDMFSASYGPNKPENLESGMDRSDGLSLMSGCLWCYAGFPLLRLVSLACVWFRI